MIAKGARQNAVPVAGVLLLTVATMTEKPEKHETHAESEAA
jgi:hypothetical protein